MLKLFSVLLILFLTNIANARTLAIGNSLSYDARAFHWADYFHGRGGWSLPQMVASPYDLSGLSDGSYLDAGDVDIAVIQLDAHHNTKHTFTAEITAIQSVVNATTPEHIVIYTGWPYHEKIDEEYSSTDTTKHYHSPAYFDSVVSEISSLYPGRLVNRTRHIDVVWEMYNDPGRPENWIAPIETLSTLHNLTVRISHRI